MRVFRKVFSRDASAPKAEEADKKSQKSTPRSASGMSEERRAHLEKKTRELHARGGVGVADPKAMKRSDAPVEQFAHIGNTGLEPKTVQFAPPHENEWIDDDHEQYEKLVKVKSAPDRAGPAVPASPTKSAMRSPTNVKRFSTT